MSDLHNLKQIIQNNKLHYYNGKKSSYTGHHVDILVGIGKDETATITLSVEAYKALIKADKEDVS